MSRLAVTNLAVTITGFQAFEDVADFKLTTHDGVGTFNWDHNSGLLLDKWCDNVKFNIDLTTKGGFSSVTGGQINLNNTTGLSNFLRSKGLGLQGCKIRITYAGYIIFTGVVIRYEYSTTELILFYDDFQKYRTTIISSIMRNGEYAPALFGNAINAQFKESFRTFEDVTGRSFEYYYGDVTEFNRVIVIYCTDGLILERLRTVSDALDSGSTDYYIYCIQGAGSGLAFKIRRLNVAYSGGFIQVHLTESLRIDKDSNSVFKPLTTQYPEGPAIEIEVEKYTDISVFKIYKVQVEYEADSWPAKDTYGVDRKPQIYDSGYIEIPREGLVKINGDLSIRLDANTLTGYLNKAEKYMQLEGLDFAFSDRSLYDNNVMGSPFGSDTGAAWKSLGSNYTPYYSRLLIWTTYVDYIEHTDIRASFDFLKKPDSMFNNTHESKIKVTVAGLSGYSNLNHNIGLPFRFRLKVPGHFKDVVLNYNIKLTLEHDDLQQLITALNLNTMRYALLTAVEGYTDSVNVRGTYPRLYPMGVISFDSEARVTGNLIRTIRIQRLNTNYDLPGFVYGLPDTNVTPEDTANSGLMYNANFLRQDIIPSVIDLGNGVGHVQYLSGYDSIRDDGKGVFDVRSVFSRPGRDLDIQIEAMLVIGMSNGTSSTRLNGVRQIIEFKGVQALALSEISLGQNIYLLMDGRRERRTSVYGGYAWDLMTSAQDIYKHLIRLQNYNTSYEPALTRPPKGWGTWYCTDDENEYDIVLGDVSSLDAIRDQYGNPMSISHQLNTEQELSTSNIKSELLRTVWCGGFIDNLGRERTFSMLVEPDEFVNIAYETIIPGTLSRLATPDPVNIFCEPAINFNYDIGKGTYDSSIKIVGLNTSAPSVIKVNAPLDRERENELLHRCEILYKAYGVINEPPQQLIENKWINHSLDAYQYLLNWLSWMGSGSDYTLLTKLKIQFSIPLRFALVNELSLGAHVKLTLPYLEDSCKGLIVGILWGLNKGSEAVRLDVLLSVPMYYATRIIEETGYANLIIDESGNLTNNISEKGYL